MENLNFADLDGSLKETPPELVGMYPLGGGGLVEAPYRHYFESRHFKKIVRLAKHMRVLELGSGNGRWALTLGPSVRSYTGVDVTPHAVQIAREAVERHAIRNCSFQQASILDFRAEGKTYDLIYFSGVSQYLEDEQLDDVLGNVELATSRNTIIVDRSTINYGWRDTVRRPGYFSILRTPEDLKQIFKKHGFELTYIKRSYRFLRGARFLLQLPRINVLCSIINATRPLSLYTMLGVSALADSLRPHAVTNGDWDHVFLRFEKA